jgi:hypothetical protein
VSALHTLQINVPPVIIQSRLKISLKRFALVLLVIQAAVLLVPSRLFAQDVPVIVGRIEGDDLVIRTTTPTGVQVSAGPMSVLSGSDITLRSGHALLRLETGGEVSICGPAHFTLLKSAGAVTLALDYGRIRPSLDLPETLTIYTPTIVAIPVAISGARRDATIGLDQNGAMCVLATRGAMRIEPQFSGQSLLVPQGGAVNLGSDQGSTLSTDVSSCSCEYPRRNELLSREISALSRPPQPEQKNSDAATPAVPAQEPVYTAFMPPLVFDANSPTPPPGPSRETIILVREVRVRPSITFHGRVNPAPVQALAIAPPVHPTPTPAVPPNGNRAAQTQQAQPGILTRARNFVRKWVGF